MSKLVPISLLLLLIGCIGAAIKLDFWASKKLSASRTFDLGDGVVIRLHGPVTDLPGSSQGFGAKRWLLKTPKHSLTITSFEDLANATP